MLTVEEIIDWCCRLDEQMQHDAPLLLSESEIKMLVDTFCFSDEDKHNDCYTGKCRGSFMGHPIFNKHEPLDFAL